MYDVEKLLEEGELDLDSASRNIESLGNDRIIDFNRLLFPGTDKQEEKGTLQIFFPPEQSHDTGQSADEEKDNDGTADNTSSACVCFGSKLMLSTIPKRSPRASPLYTPFEIKVLAIPLATLGNREGPFGTDNYRYNL